MDEIKYYYQILELKPGASVDEIKRAYKDLAKVWHPDRFTSDHHLQQKANDKLKEINFAFKELMTYVASANVEIFQPQETSSSIRTQRSGEETTSDSSERIPCIDGNCIGIINQYGYCNICGKPSGDFSKNQEIPELSMETYSLLPIYQMVQKDKPFNDWKDAETEIPMELEDTFQGCVWMYQMYFFYILTAKRFGYEVADKMLHIQSEKLKSVSSLLGEQVDIGVRQIHRNLLHQIENPYTVELRGETVNMPVEYCLALEFLTLGKEAPFHIDGEEFKAGNLPNFKGADFALAECLAHGKDTAVAYFEPIIRICKLAF